MTNEEAISLLTQVNKILVNSNSWLENTHEPLNMAFDMAIKALSAEPCEDCISRKATYEQIHCWIGSGEYRYTNATDYLTKRVIDLPSIQPKQKTGHWIEHPHEAGINWEASKYECSECHAWVDDDSDYCPDCGAKMEE